MYMQAAAEFKRWRPIMALELCKLFKLSELDRKCSQNVIIWRVLAQAFINVDA